MKYSKKEPLGRMIYLTAQEIKNFAQKILFPYDLTLEQFHPLKKNVSNIRNDPAQSWRNSRHQTPANITRILDRLESKSLILRKSNPKDRRSSQVFLTDQGQKLVQQVSGILESFSENLTEGIKPEEQRKNRTTLDRIVLNIASLSHKMKTNRNKEV